ncbi:MAG: heme-binding protein, partial [Thermoanaerobaculia bacterium]
MRNAVLAATLILAFTADAQRVRAVRKSFTTHAEPSACAATPPAPIQCADGGTPAASLSAAEVETVARAAASVEAQVTVAVVDRAGRPLAVFRQAGVSDANDELAVGIARTAAFFSHNQAPLSSRTVRFISGIHFPPDITNTPSAALYGIENTNRGCDLGIPSLPRLLNATE